MPAVLNIKPQDVETQQKRQTFNVAVVGCGHKGIFYANTFAEAGYRVVCTDADASVIKKVAKGKTSFADSAAEAKLKSHIAAEKIDVVGELKKAVGQSDIVVVAITAKLDDQKKNDYTSLLATCKQTGAALHSGTIVIYGGIAGLGFLEGTVKGLLEDTSGLKAGRDFALAYSPLIRTQAGSELELTVSGSDKVSVETAAVILRTLTQKIHVVKDLKTAEAATLFSIAIHDAQTALANELAVFCEDAGIDFYKVLEALNNRNTDFKPTVDEESKHEAYILLEGAENFNSKLKLPTMARQINEDILRHAVNLTAEALRGCGKTLRRGRVAVLGSSNPCSSAAAFAKLIEQKGAKVAVYDPSAKKAAQDEGSVKTGLSDAVEGADCIVLVSDGEQFNHLNLKKIKSLMKSPSVIVDLAGHFEPSTVETEGFIYAGLGRGNDKK